MRITGLAACVLVGVLISIALGGKAGGMEVVLPGNPAFRQTLGDLELELLAFVKNGRVVMRATVTNKSRVHKSYEIFSHNTLILEMRDEKQVLVWASEAAQSSLHGRHIEFAPGARKVVFARSALIRIGERYFIRAVLQTRAPMPSGEVFTSSNLPTR